MNLIDIVIFLIMCISMVVGSYNGLVVSALHAASFFLSWLISVIFYPLFTKMILGLFPSLFQMVSLYAEGSSHIKNFEDKAASLQTFTREGVKAIVDSSQIPSPFNKILVSDFSQSIKGIQTLGEYFDTTMAMVIINILSFLALFFLIKIVLHIIVSLYRNICDLPVLKKYDSAAGAGFGLICGFFISYMIAALIPILLVLVPAGIVNEYLDGSKLASFFYHSNIFINFVRGI